MKHINSVLVIDNDFTSRYLVQSLLSDLSIADQTLMAASAHEALDLLRNLSDTDTFPELILLDIRMPLFDGFDFLDQLAKLEHPGISGTKIVLLSYYGNRQYKELAQRYPVAAYFQKPLTEEKLREVLGN